MPNALILVDLQNDFLPSGALAVKDGDVVIPLLNRILDRFDHVIASQDWHPEGHGSFASSHPGRKVGEQIELGGLPQVLWPDHCVAGTSGADFAPELHREHIGAVFRKGTDPEIDSYSGFFDNGHRRSTGLHDHLMRLRVDEVVIAGLATDYCVQASALDAAELGYRTTVITDACRGVDLQPGDVGKALESMQKAGVRLIPSTEVRPRQS